MADIPFSRVQEWLFDDALPFWVGHGCRDPLVFCEICSLDGEPQWDAILRVRVIARQVYVFSHAAILGWPGPALERAGAGVEALIGRVWQGPDVGWARLMSADGALADGRADLYDFAFVLFALGWWMKASGDHAAEPYANATLDLIEKAMAHPSGRGHVHMLPAAPPYVQNPHMHLLEACLVMDDATGDPRWMQKAAELVDLFRTAFFDPETGDLTEFFDIDWRPGAGTEGDVVEPGHQLEWAWILNAYMQRSGQSLRSEIRALVDAAEQRGISPVTGLVYGAVSKSGKVIDGRHRIWPQTERIKGNLALCEMSGEDRSVQISAAVNALLDGYLAPAPRGGWIDVLDSGGAPIAKNIPASTFYHLFLAFAELLRLQDRAGPAELAAKA